MASIVEISLNALYSFLFDNTMPGMEVPCIISAIYVVVVLLSRRYMSSREPHRSKGLFLVHNMILFFYSLFAFASFLWDLYINHNFSGIIDITCDPDKHLWVAQYTPVLMRWFALSKIYELFDTAFIILNKSKLRGLHVYHHAITMVLGWYVFRTQFNLAIVFGVTNSFVHVLMYYYYSLSCLGYSVWWKQYLTSIQIFQFIICMSLMVYHTLQHYVWHSCPGTTSWGAITFSACAYVSFLVLFVLMFIENARTMKRSRRSTPAKKSL